MQSAILTTPRWLSRPHHPEQVQSLVNELGLSPLLARVLVARGFIDAPSARSFLDSSLATEPFAADKITGLSAVAQALSQAIDYKRRILVFGDFDVDGLSATALLYLALQALGAEVSYIIPSRLNEGYGLTEKVIPRILADNPQTLVTVDCGISALEEVKMLAKAGIEVLISDHHEAGEQVPIGVPVADPKLDPQSFGQDLAGAGVALGLVKLVGQLQGQAELWLEFTDLATLGTIADMVSLSGFNRALVRVGLEQINRAPRPGIQALAALETRDQPLTASSLSYGMIPRLNAPGRLGQPEVAIQILIESKPDIASQQAAKLQELNNERRRLEAELSSEAMTQVMAGYQAGQKLVVVASANWHEGIRGIIASRIAHQLGVPAIVFTLVDGEARGSGRSVGAVKLFSALSAVSDLALRFGGHESAVGVTVRPEDIALFSERLEAELAKQAEESFNPPTTVDAQLDLSELDLPAVQQLSLLEPFGHNNPQPLFVSRPLTLSSQRLVGNQGQHLSFTVDDGQASQSAIWFNCPEIEGLTENPGLLELAFEPTVESWRGQQTLRLRVTEAFPSDPDTLLERAFPELRGSLYPAQEQTLELLSAGHSPLCLMPTGRGKSLVFQLFASQLALTKQAVSLFVYPLRALINDQQQNLVNRLSAIGLNSRVLCGLSSTEERSETYQALASGQVAVILTTPEFLLLHALDITRATALGHNQVAFIAVDEAHHITADGISQRPAYSRLTELRRFFPTAQVLAATATADQETALQISQTLGLDSLVIDTSRRPNLKLNDQRDAPDRLQQVVKIVGQKTPVVVYVYSRDEARFLVRDLRKALPEQALTINYYHAGLLTELRQTIEQDFSKGESSCLVCTSAFGEGINIANIRHLVLYHPPFSRTALNQLAGRAGRDGLQSTIHQLFNQQDITNIRKLLKDSLPSYEGMAALYRYLRALAKTTDNITLPDQTLAIAVERQDAKHPLSASQVNLTLRIFAELGLIDIRQAGLLRQLVVHVDQQKVELQASSIYLEAYDELSEFDAFSEWLMSAQSLELEQFIQGPILPITGFSTGSATGGVLSSITNPASSTISSTAPTTTPTTAPTTTPTTDPTTAPTTDPTTAPTTDPTTTPTTTPTTAPSPAPTTTPTTTLSPSPTTDQPPTVFSTSDTE